MRPQENELAGYLGEDVFRVEAIRRKRVNDGVCEYFIKWEGWDRHARPAEDQARAHARRCP